ncbi:MAG: EscN/YscN/HrcN family type III secretion system ATPase [Planctomycetota bacterium]|nr:MAG: EscN/YscN/HrcN family type III secretion system ATPase [Planctomycetota bacterium]
MTVLDAQFDIARAAPTLGVTGRVASFAGMTLQASGLPAPLGALCEVQTGPDRALFAEVIGFRQGMTLLMPIDTAEGVCKGQRIRLVTTAQKIAVGPELLGQVIDGMGRRVSDGRTIEADTCYPLQRSAPEATSRPRIDAPISVGIRSINALLTIGSGQRMGIFAGTGVGKSVLLGMMARYTSADVAVIALIGERGREVGDFIAKDLGTAGLRRSVVVVSTSDQSPPLRIRACLAATAIAEYFRDRGANVLLLMDSVTRMAMAGRQIGLAAGEPPATKGYPPSVFAMMPRLMERCGRTVRGSITGLYTVLVEGDDLNEPIADAARGILDGHVWLSRRLASRGQYPAVSVLDSISRVMPDITDAAQLAAASRVRRLLAVWSEIEDLVNIGAYAAGSNPEYDVTIRMRPAVEAFLKQAVTEPADFEASRESLLRLAREIQQAEAAAASPKPAAAGARR